MYSVQDRRTLGGGAPNRVRGHFLRESPGAGSLETSKLRAPCRLASRPQFLRGSVTVVLWHFGKLLGVSGRLFTSARFAPWRLCERPSGDEQEHGSRLYRTERGVILSIMTRVSHEFFRRFRDRQATKRANNVAEKWDPYAAN